MLPIGGAINGTERYAIDFAKLAQGSSPVTQASGVFLLEPGTDGTKNEDYASYGAPLLAVADATVVKVVSDVPDTAPGPPPGGEERLAVDDAGGNVVVLRIAPRLFAFYLHNAPGSTTVKVGDKVTKGQQIAELGSSGNSLAPHLHFQLGRSRQMLTTENVPYVFERFVVEGTVTDSGVVAEPAPPRRTAPLGRRRGLPGISLAALGRTSTPMRAEPSSRFRAAASVPPGMDLRIGEDERSAPRWCPHRRDLDRTGRTGPRSTVPIWYGYEPGGDVCHHGHRLVEERAWNRRALHACACRPKRRRSPA